MKKTTLGQLQFHHLGHLDYSDNMKKLSKGEARRVYSEFFPLFRNFPPLPSASKIQLEEHTGGLESFPAAKSSKKLCLTMDTKYEQMFYLVQTINS